MKLRVTLALLYGDDPHALVYREGNLSEPMVCLTWHQMRRLRDDLSACIEKAEQFLLHNEEMRDKQIAEFAAKGNRS